MASERDAATIRGAVYVISAAAELAGVHPQTLRFYERRGLIRPRRTPGGDRRFSDRDIERLRRIQRLTAEGVSLAGVQRILDLEDRLERARLEIARLHRQSSSRAQSEARLTPG